MERRYNPRISAKPKRKFRQGRHVRNMGDLAAILDRDKRRRDWLVGVVGALAEGLVTHFATEPVTPIVLTSLGTIVYVLRMPDVTSDELTMIKELILSDEIYGSEMFQDMLQDIEERNL